MTVTGEKLPPPTTLLFTIDAEARASIDRAKLLLTPIVEREVPRKSGQTARALRPRVSKISTGTALTINAPRGKGHQGSGATIAEVVRWVNRGTGIHRSEGPGPYRKIRPAKLFRHGKLAALSVYGRPVRSVKGQRPNPFMRRIFEAGDLRVRREVEQGAVRAARAVERRFVH